MSDRDQRTEQPTPRRLQKAREEGRFLSSRELAGAAQFTVLTALAGHFTARWVLETRDLTRTLLEAAFRRQLDAHEIGQFLVLSVRSQGPIFLVMTVVLALAPIVLQAALTKMGFSFKQCMPDFGRLSPLNRLRDLPGHNLAAFAQATLVLMLVAWAAWQSGAKILATAGALPLLALEASAALAGSLLLGVLWKGSAFLLLVGLLDLARQWKKHRTSLRMTKQEVKEELKESEGNPQVKMKIRRLQRDFARRRMMQQVPTATAVVVNPTHYAVALRYDMESFGAPKVVAKGRNYLAQRIRQIATEHNVPIVENAPLAQALYKSTEVGQEIPAHLYRAVAEILAYLYRVLNGRLPNTARV